MMKKMLRMLLLGFLTVTVLSPSVVTAEEDQTGQVPSSSVYSEIDGIAPMATPFIEEITLEHGEYYDITRNILFSSPGSHNLGVPYVLVKFATISGDNEAFSVEFLTNVPGQEGLGASYFYSNLFDYPVALRSYQPENWDIRFYGYRFTNFSAGPVTYKVGINVTYGTYEGLEFDLFNFD